MGKLQNCAVKRLVFAYYVTGHGFGHATRVVEIARGLTSHGHKVFVVSSAPEYIFTGGLQVRRRALDCGAVQSDALSVDRQASLELYTKVAVEFRSLLLEEESAWLRAIGADLVVSDIVPLACAAAFKADVPSVCVSNFSWDYIYSEYIAEVGSKYKSIVYQISEDYSKALGIIRLPGFCPMPSFRTIIDVPLVVRPAKRSKKEVRADLGIPLATKVLLLNFGGQSSGWSLKEEFLPCGWKCIVCGKQNLRNDLPQNFIQADRDAYTPDLLRASNAMLGKLGYGTVSEALSLSIPFIFLTRRYFGEEPFLRSTLQQFQAGVEMDSQDFATGNWGPSLEAAEALECSYKGPINGGEVTARLLEEAALGRWDLNSGGEEKCWMQGVKEQDLAELAAR